MIVGIPSQRIIQGKTYTLKLNFKEEYAEKINKVWFTSSELNICKLMVKDGNSFNFKLSFEETAKLKPMMSNFNITAEFNDEERTRDMATNIGLIIEKNSNPVTCEE